MKGEATDGATGLETVSSRSAAFFSHRELGFLLLITLVLILAYGLSICFYVYAQRDLGAAKTSAYYAVAPFIGGIMSLLIFREIPGPLFLTAAVIMLIGTHLVNRDQPA